MAEFVVGFLLGASIFAVGALTGHLTARQSDDGLAKVRQELSIARHEVGVLLNIMESIGIKFNRDHDRNVTGLIIDVEATLQGVSDLAGGNSG